MLEILKKKFCALKKECHGCYQGYEKGKKNECDEDIIERTNVNSRWLNEFTLINHQIEKFSTIINQHFYMENKNTIQCKGTKESKPFQFQLLVMN